MIAFIGAIAVLVIVGLILTTNYSPISVDYPGAVRLDSHSTTKGGSSRQHPF